MLPAPLPPLPHLWHASHRRSANPRRSQGDNRRHLPARSSSRKPAFVPANCRRVSFNSAGRRRRRGGSGERGRGGSKERKKDSKTSLTSPPFIPLLRCYSYHVCQTMSVDIHLYYSRQVSVFASEASLICSDPKTFFPPAAV